MKEKGDKNVISLDEWERSKFDAFIRQQRDIVSLHAARLLEDCDKTLERLREQLNNQAVQDICEKYNEYTLLSQNLFIGSLDLLRGVWDQYIALQVKRLETCGEVSLEVIQLITKLTTEFYDNLDRKKNSLEGAPKTYYGDHKKGFFVLLKSGK